MTIPPEVFEAISGGSAPAGTMDLDTGAMESMAEMVPPAPPASQGDFPRAVRKLPPAMIPRLTKEKKETLTAWLDEQISNLEAAQSTKQLEWAKYEEAYRAKSIENKTLPFNGASGIVVPVIAMAVDPITARLDTGIFKQDPVFSLTALKKSTLPYTKSLQTWTNFYFKNILHIRNLSVPRMLEFSKLGTMVFKTVYDREEYDITTYDENDEIIKRTDKRFSGPRVFGISLGDFMFPAGYQNVQDCPIVVERQRTTWLKLKVAEASKKLVGVDLVKGQETPARTLTETERSAAVQHESSTLTEDAIVVHEVWFDYDIDGDGLPERLVATLHKDTRTLLQLRFNWYYNQRKPYTVIPYTVSNESLYGMGIAEMSLPFQEAITQWERMAEDNAYLANIRMYAVKADNSKQQEQTMRIYAGRQIPVDDPKNDIVPIQLGDTYNSTIQERQNLFGLLEKRTGVSDYLTGRESPIVGSRATATSTLALIQEGTKRVEEVLENIRFGFAEIVQNCFAIWSEYGLEGIDDLVFGDDQVGSDVREFFLMMRPESVNGAVAIDLSATDASNSRQAMQQIQLQIMQTMMGYYDRVLAMGQQAIQMIQQGQPEMAALMSDVTEALKKSHDAFLHNFNIRNPEEFLVDFDEYLAATSARMAGGAAGQLGGGAGAPSAQPGPPAPTGNGASPVPA